MVAVVSPYAPRPTPQRSHVQLHRPMARDEGGDGAALQELIMPKMTTGTRVAIIAGSVAGGVLLVAIITLLLVKFLPKKDKRDKAGTNETPTAIDVHRIVSEKAHSIHSFQPLAAPVIVGGEDAAFVRPISSYRALGREANGAISNVATMNAPNPRSFAGLDANPAPLAHVDSRIKSKPDSVRSLPTLTINTDTPAAPKAHSLSNVQIHLEDAQTARVDPTRHHNSFVQHAERC